jgi:cytochrome P450
MMALWRVATMPSIMEGLRKEQAQILKQYGPQWTSDVLQAMKYTEAVVKETLRLHSPGQISMRRAAKDFELDGYWIKKGEIASLLLVF